MMRPITVLLLMLAASLPSAIAQNREQMALHQQRLAELLVLTASAPTDNERYLASEQAVGELSAALEEEESEHWKWQLPKVASVLTSPDGLLRIFTWAVVRDNGEFECFGAIQYYNDREEEYQYSLLNDKSEEIMNREESLLSPENWFGAVYQELIQTSHGGKTFYTLLGWNGVDNLTERKIIEPVILRGGVPQFGAPLFRREYKAWRVCSSTISLQDSSLPMHSLTANGNCATVHKGASRTRN